MEIKLTPLQSFNIMRWFLEGYYSITYSDQLGELLGVMNMQLFGDGTQTADPALWDDWIECIGNKNFLTLQEAYCGTAQFIASQYALEPDEYIVALLDGMRFLYNKDAVNTIFWQQWLSAVKKELKAYKL